MKGKVLLFFAVLFFSKFSFGQDSGIKGSITDSSANASVVLASVAVIRQKDSVLAAYGRSNEAGNFQISNLKSGDYILLISYPRYGDYVELISLGENEIKDMNTISLTPKAKLLDEIVIGQSPILIKGDTTEYVADSFKVRENANVEELLKKLPGIQVDKDGKIIAQGKQVQKILVDGDEFFSDDPTVATKNLRADAISKVQVYDKRSDQAAFTGIDDGQEVKTIDLKLKENAKKGYFGKASVAGLDKYYNATAMINSFKAKRKLSAFGVASSTSETGLGFNDSRSLGFNDNSVISFDGGTMMVMGSFGSGELSAGNSFGEGLPESIKAGAHYSDKWNEGKNSAGGNYLFNQLNTRAGGNSFSENTLLDSVYYRKSSSSSYQNKMQQSLSGVMEIQIDSTSQIKITANGNTASADSDSRDLSEVLSEEYQTVNTSDRKTLNHNDNNSMNTTAFWRKRFKKAGRTISINLSQRYNDSKSDGYLNNIARFFDETGNQIKEELTDQNKVNTTENQTWEARASYTNPLGKKSFLELNYSFNHNDNYQKRLSYDKDASDKYSKLVDSLSSDFQYIYNTHSGGLNYRYNGKKLSFSAGGNVSSTGFEQNDRFEDSKRTYSYTNFFPRGNVRYKINSFSGFDLNYNGSTSQPTIDQLQPLKNNSDPMNIIVGNPDLRQSFSNNIGLNYNSFQMMTEQYIFAGANFSTVSDQISSSYKINSGRRITQYINVDGNYSLSFYGNYSRKLGKSNWRIGLSPNFSFSKNTSFINETENVTNNFRFSPSLRFDYSKVEKLELELDFAPSYNSSKSSVSTERSRKYWTHNISSNARYTLPLKIDVGTDIEFEFREKLNAEDTKNRLILWNAFVEKRFLKKEQLVLRFSMHDILDQNKGYERIVQPDAIVERNFLTFQRYGLITLTYNFNTTGTGGTSRGSGPAIRIR